MAAAVGDAADRAIGMATFRTHVLTGVASLLVVKSSHPVRPDRAAGDVRLQQCEMPLPSPASWLLSVRCERGEMTGERRGLRHDSSAGALDLFHLAGQN